MRFCGIHMFRDYTFKIKTPSPRCQWLKQIKLCMDHLQVLPIVNIGSGAGLLSVGHQAITGTKLTVVTTGPLEIKIQLNLNKNTYTYKHFFVRK